jgi:hypothetical protein
MFHPRIHKTTLNYRPIGRRILGQPLKKPLEAYNRKAVTAHLLA